MRFIRMAGKMKSYTFNEKIPRKETSSLRVSKDISVLRRLKK
jgi:hypothetical protein